MEEIVTVVLCANHVPETGRCQAMKRIHFILKACLITVNFFQIVNDSNVWLYLIFLLPNAYSLFGLRLFNFYLLFRSFFSVY